MKLSVIMPCYNAACDLEKAVESVFSGGVEDMELIVIDDASCDSSPELLSRLREREGRIVAVCNEKNLGVGRVRNMGLSLARGEYVAFCDCDDTVPEGAYMNMLSDIGNNDIVIGGYRLLSDAGRDDTVLLSGRQRRELFYALFSGSSLWHKMIKRSFIEEHSLAFPEDVTLGEDVIFLSRLFTHTPSFAVTDAVVYNYYNRTERCESSLTHRYTLEKFKEHIGCRERMLEITEPVFPEARDYIYSHFVEYLDRFLMHINPSEREEAFLIFKEYMSRYPYDDRPELFLALTGVPYGVFKSASAYTYMQAKAELLARERVLFEFSTGRIGLRWVLKYVFAWIRYKLSGRK